MSKKTFATIGMIVCVLFVIAGFITMEKTNSCSTGSRSGLFDSGLATFGSDFYTYSNNNAAEAASAARTTANNVKEVYTLLCDMFGWFFVFIGSIGLCHFGIIRADCNAPASPKAEIGKHSDFVASNAIPQYEAEDNNK